MTALLGNVLIGFAFGAVIVAVGTALHALWSLIIEYWTDR